MFVSGDYRMICVLITTTETGDQHVIAPDFSLNVKLTFDYPMYYFP